MSRGETAGSVMEGSEIQGFQRSVEESSWISMEVSQETSTTWKSATYFMSIFSVVLATLGALGGVSMIGMVVVALLSMANLVVAGIAEVSVTSESAKSWVNIISVVLSVILLFFTVGCIS